MAPIFTITRESHVHPEVEEGTIQKQRESGRVLWKKALETLKSPKVLAGLAVFAIIIAALLVTVIVAMFTSQKDQLVFVYMIWRHGDRAPEREVPKIPLPTEAFPNGEGRLTNIGEYQTRILGEKIRSRYFQDESLKEKVYVRSTNVSRTIESAKNVLAGIGIPNVPVVAEIPMEIDTEANPFFQCAHAQKLVEEIGDAYLMKDDYEEVYSLLEKHANHTDYVYPLMDQILCMKYHNLPIPMWSQDESLMQQLKMLSWLGLEARFGMQHFKNGMLNRLRGGSILRGAANHLLRQAACSASNWEENCNIYFYGVSAHDLTLIALLSTFSDVDGIFGEVPYVFYAANIAFELWKSSGDYKLKVLYANSYSDQPRDITRHVPGCGDSEGLCDLENFALAAAPLTPQNVQEECGNIALSGRQKREATYFKDNLVEYFLQQ